MQEDAMQKDAMQEDAMQEDMSIGACVVWSYICVPWERKLGRRQGRTRGTWGGE